MQSQRLKKEMSAENKQSGPIRKILSGNGPIRNKDDNIIQLRLIPIKSRKRTRAIRDKVFVITHPGKYRLFFNGVLIASSNDYEEMLRLGSVLETPRDQVVVKDTNKIDRFNQGGTIEMSWNIGDKRTEMGLADVWWTSPPHNSTESLD